MIRSIIIFLLFFSIVSVELKASSVNHDEPFIRTIPIRIEQELMFTDVTIEGEVYNFLIDTGAPFVFSPELAEKLNFRPKQVAVVGSSNTRSGSARLGTFKKDVEVGGLKFSNFKALVMDYDANTQVIRCLGFDGIIGANFMSGAVWQIDYDNNEITITNQLRKLPKVKESWSIKMEKRGFNKSPYIAVKVNEGKSTRVLFDSGFAGFFDLPYSAYSNALKSGRITDEMRVLEGRGIMGEGAFGADDTTGYYMQVPRLIIGKETISRPDFIVSHTRNSKVGVEYLKGRLVTLDFPRKRFYVYEKEDKYIPISLESFLFGTSMIDGELRVTAIFENETTEQPLQMGDVILEVDDKVIAEMDECDALIFMRNQISHATSMELKVKREEEIINLKLTKSLIFSK